MGFSRREFLKASALGVAGSAVGVRLAALPARAAAQDVPIGSAFYRTTLGDFEVTVIRDGVAALPAERLAANAAPEDINALLQNAGFPTGEQPNNFKQLLLKTADSLVLFDTGRGAPDSQLIATLQLIGAAPEAITHVILSHWHPDHIGGVASNGAPAFPNAQYLMAQGEWDLLNSDASNSGFSGALATLSPVTDAGLLDFFNADEEIISGVTSVSAPGHTPSHSAFLITSGDRGLLNTVDAIIHPVISVQRTDWHFGFDANPDQAVETRRTLLDRIASENLMMFGYHFPFPGIGYVAAADEENTWRFTMASY